MSKGKAYCAFTGSSDQVLFLLCQFSSWLDFSFKVVVCLPVPCWIKLTPVLQIQGFMSGQKR